MVSSQIEKDIKKCELLWQEFSPKQSLFDLWDFWLAFYSAYRHQPYFIVLQENNKNIGLLPLWYEKEKKKYYWLGGLWQEDISFWVKDPVYISTLLFLCPKQTFLNGITIEDAMAKKIQKLVSEQEKNDFGVDESKYVLDISEIKSFEDYLASLKKERRKSIKKDLSLIEQQNPEIIFNNFRDFDSLVALSKQRFADKIENKNDPWAHSGWKDIRQIKAFSNIIQNTQKKYQPQMITIKINKKIAGVDLAIIFNDCYYALLCGYDVKMFPGIGNYFNMLNIKDALNLGLKKIDALQCDYGWKHRWYKEVPLYYFSKD